MNGPDRRDRHTRPQLFGNSRAAVQARRAAGCAFRSSGSAATLVIGDPGSIFVENAHPKTNWIAARRLVRGIARSKGLKASMLSGISRDFDTQRRKALGLKPRVLPR
jgi:hypothetical protein